jgi:PAS domain S-box-containing protein
MLDLLARQAADLIEHRQREDAHHRVWQKLQIVTDAMEAVVAQCSRDLRYVWVSDALSRWVGLAPERIVGHEILEILGQEAFDALRPRFEQVLAGQTVEFEDEINYKGRGTRWIHAVYRATRNAAGEVDGWVSVVTDITERVLIEQTLRDADQVKDEFMALVSHDLRNPLSVIAMTAGALLMQTTDDRVRTGVDRIQRAADGMVRLVSDLLDSAAITRGQLRLDLDLCDAALLVRKAVESLSPLATAKGLWTTAKTPERALLVRCDHGRIQQVLGNLIGNAIKYSRPGTTVTVRVELAGDDVRFSVEDSGRGIAADRLPRIFDRFVTADPAHKGRGLGLYIAKGIVEAHGGRIGGESTLAVGSTFWFTLAPVHP